MNNKTTVFFIIFIGLILFIAGHNFVRYYIARDYILNVFTSCDSTQHNCFKADPNTADLTFQSGTYEKIQVSAAYAPSCLDEHNCPDFSCDARDSVCNITYCSDDNLDEGESCTNNK